MKTIYVVLRFTTDTDTFLHLERAYDDSENAHEDAIRWTCDAEQRNLGVVFVVQEVLLEE